MNIGSEKQRDHDEKVVEIEMKDVFDVCSWPVSYTHLVINNIIDKPEKLKVTKDSEGNEFAELSCDVAPNMGITVRGI